LAGLELRALLLPAALPLRIEAVRIDGGRREVRIVTGDRSGWFAAGDRLAEGWRLIEIGAHQAVLLSPTAQVQRVPLAEGH
jgi:hypothetical protein